MVKIIAILVLTLSVLPAVHEKGNEIPWSASRRLTWSDFQGAPDRHATNAALTSSKIVFNYGYGSEKGFTYSISCVFDKMNSWGRVRTDYILSHEQGHFDIAELYTRKLNKMMKKYTFNSKTSPKEVPAMYRQLMQDEADYQNVYDSETDFSRNKPGQEAWLNKIRKQLDELEDYAGYAK